MKAKMGGIKDAANLKISQTAGGRLAAEIRNPGSAQNLREDRLAIAQSQTPEGRAQAARGLAATGLAAVSAAQQNSEPNPAFDGNSLAGGNSNKVDAEAETAAFRDKHTDKS